MPTGSTRSANPSMHQCPMSVESTYFDFIFPSAPTTISVAPGGISEAVDFPPGHLTRISVGASGIAITWTTESCDQYPEPPCTSRDRFARLR